MNKKNYTVYPLEMYKRKIVEQGCQIEGENKDLFWFMINQISDQVIQHGAMNMDRSGVFAPWIVLDEYFQQDAYHMFQFLMIQIVDGQAVQTKFSASAKATEDKVLAVCRNFDTITGEKGSLEDLQITISVSPKQNGNDARETRYLSRQVESNYQLENHEIAVVLGNPYCGDIMWHSLPRENWNTSLENAEDYLHAYVLTRTLNPQK